MPYDIVVQCFVMPYTLIVSQEKVCVKKITQKRAGCVLTNFASQL